MSVFLRQSTVLLRRLVYNFPRVSSARNYAVDEDGDINQMRSTVTILNEEKDEGVFIDSYSTLGFRLSNGIRVMGPCAVFPRSVLHWNVGCVTDINEESLTLFAMIEPKIDILVLGVGERENIGKIDLDVIKYLQANKINIEVLSTDQALSTFNFLNAEKRFVAGAFIPPSYVNYDENEDPLGRIPEHVDPAVMSTKEFAGYDDDDLSGLEDMVKERRERMRKKRVDEGEYDE